MKLDYTRAADALAVRHGIPPMLFSALFNAESAWNPNAVSSTGAKGLGQFTTATAKTYGLMGAGFDNRADAALNMTAAALYLADLKKDPDNPTWRSVIGHYSGQGEALAKYATYSAGQLLIGAVDAADGVTAPPAPGGDIEVTVGVTQAGQPTRFSLKAAAAAAMLLATVGSVGFLACCSAPPSRPQIAESPIPGLEESTFYFVHGPRGLETVRRLKSR